MNGYLGKLWVDPISPNLWEGLSEAGVTFTETSGSAPFALQSRHTLAPGSSFYGLLAASNGKPCTDSSSAKL